MARKQTWGTPGRSERYLRPRPAFALVGPALLLLVAVAALYLGAHALGWRRSLSPGPLSARHGSYGARCEECHLPRGGGASAIRCQRCHDPGSGGRLTLAAHVYFGSLDAARAASAGEVACARCHVEHRGAGFDLRQVGQPQCVRCHSDPRRVQKPIRRFAEHPEFAVLSSGSTQVVGLIYSHLTHVTRGKGKKAGYITLNAERRQRGLDTPEATCTECHLREPGDADFDPLDFDRHCLDCHRSDALKMDPVNAAEVVPFESLDERLVEGWSARAEDFERQGALLLKPRVHHKDEWILFNLRKLRRELDPEGFAADVRALRARRAQLERRLALARPLAQEDSATLEARAQAVAEELAQIDARLLGQQQAQAPQAGARLDEVAALAAAAGGPDERALADRLAREARAVRAAPRLAAALPREEWDARREELLRLLDAVLKAAPERRPQVDELRRRLHALQPGDASADLLRRAREQRQASLERIEDERRLRATHTRPPTEALLRNEIRALERARDEIDRRLALAEAWPAPRAPLGEDERNRKQEAVANLTLGCRYCHPISPQGAFPPVAAARPVLWRATFRHREHLTHGESCAACHAGTRAGRPWSIETSAQASDLSVRGVESCRDCHRRGGATQACRDCHRFHPRAAS